MKFTKMHGCGNDYVIVDAVDGPNHERFANAPIEAAGPLARAMNDRRFGVGADGFVVILPESRAESDAQFEMRMYNPDGSYSQMCGNALRCVAKLLADSGRVAGESLVVRTNDTLVPMRLLTRDEQGRVATVEADLGPPIFAPEQVPCTLSAGPDGDLRATQLVAGERTVEASILSMGNPHCVVFVDDASDELVLGFGPEVETHAAFPERTNVEFVEVHSLQRLRQRTWERGAGETFACGSGAGAVAVAAALTGRTERRVTIELLGGELDMQWRESDGHVLMSGPAVEVFTAEWPSDAAA